MLTFYYGVMDSAKTANALMTRFQYIQKGKKVWLIKPATDTRDDPDGKVTTTISSRVGIKAKADVIFETDNLINLYNNSDIIICDEAQFLTPKQIEQLRELSTNIEVLCYGLRTDFRTKVFPGSKRLFELADNIIELKSICECGKQAIVNARFDDAGNLLTSGEQVCIGGNERYKAICYDCWKKLSK